MVCCFHGALLCTLGAVQASFKPIAGADADKIFRKIFFNFSGVPSQPCVFNMRSLHHRVPYLKSTPPCTKVSSSSTDKTGMLSDDGVGKLYVTHVEIMLTFHYNEKKL